MAKASRQQTSLPGMAPDHPPQDEGKGPSAADEPGRGRRLPAEGRGTGSASETGSAQASSVPAAAHSAPSRGTNAAPAQPDAAAGGQAPNAAGAGPLAGKRVFLVDANSLVFQVFHAIPEMTGPRGQPVNAVFGFTRDLLYLIEEQHADYLFCAFDPPGGTFRDALFADYKGQRAPMPESLVPQLPAIRRMLEAMGIPAIEVAGYEADDVLATVSRLADEAGAECYLVSADKDCRQLITDRVKVLNIRKQQVLDREALLADWGVPPEQVVDFQALVGDSVDNIPGVAGVGPKGARDLLAKYGSLDEILRHIDEQTPKRRESLREFLPRAELTRRLVRLDQHMPLDWNWSAGRVGQLRPAELAELCAEFGFRGFAAKFRQLETAGTAAPADTAAAGDAWQVAYQLVDTPEALAGFLDELRAQPRFSFDTETTSVSPTLAEPVGYSFCWNDNEAYYLPVRAPAECRCLDGAPVLEALRPILENPRIEKVGQNLKYDMVVLRAAGVRLQGLAFDTMLASYLLDAGERNHNLDDLAQRYLNHTNITIESLIGTGKSQKRMDQVPTDRVADYAAEDALVAWRLVAPLSRRLADSTGLEQLLRTVEQPLVEVLVELESNGIAVDVARLAQLSEEFGRLLAELEREIYELAGCEFNIASPKQLQEVLFVRHKLPVVKRTQTGPSTDAEVLEELASLHPLPAKIIEYRQYAKLKGTYVDALPALVNPRTGRVHASFNQVVAATGRLSCSDPNLQNIPIRTETGRQIRSAFLPGPAQWRLLAADYSQIELRMLAHFSGDETLCGAFARGEDIHQRVAAQIYNKPLDQVSSSDRRSAKAVNFGVIYGQSPFGLARGLGIAQAEAAEFIQAYFAQYPGVSVFLDRVLAECQTQGYVTTILGRRRAIQGIRPEAARRQAGFQRNLPERTAINTVIQGSAADLMKLAMIAVLRKMRERPLQARMLLQIHDELVFEAPLEEISELTELVEQAMTGVMQLRVPLEVDVRSGGRWSELE